MAWKHVSIWQAGSAGPIQSWRGTPDKTGPESSNTALLIIYDIFGYYPQTLQGADILAHSDQEHQYQVFIPDWFGDKPADLNWFPPTDDDKKQKLGNFFQTQGTAPDKVERIPKLVKDAQSKYPSIKKWGLVGFCWGGKVAVVTAGSTDIFSAVAQVHPAMVDPKDADNVKVPFCCLASQDEPADDIKAFKDNLKVEKHVETFPDQIHGWMAARGDLSNPKVKSEYERGYKTLLTFFHDHL